MSEQEQVDVAWDVEIGINGKWDLWTVVDDYDTACMEAAILANRCFDYRIRGAQSGKYYSLPPFARELEDSLWDLRGSFVLRAGVIQSLRSLMGRIGASITRGIKKLRGEYRLWKNYERSKKQFG